ncbi:hypothetical protein DdX_09207 [Ditylenchus destructor]|uniref:Uncharacterized protein n=1 Tax=Ditylenchus destructor TaxID=166010 RepID=A0AAD4R0A5_9BILA|nr:hypothetical protein DdX_09207 [Ditylenchus destructor]
MKVLFVVLSLVGVIVADDKPELETISKKVAPPKAKNTARDPTKHKKRKLSKLNVVVEPTPLNLEVQNEINVEDVTVPEAQADFKDAPADSPVEDQVDDLNTERPIRVRSQILLKEEGSRASNEVINEGAQPEEEQTFPPEPEVPIGSDVPSETENQEVVLL